MKWNYYNDNDPRICDGVVFAYEPDKDVKDSPVMREVWRNRTVRPPTEPKSESCNVPVFAVLLLMLLLF